MATKVARGWDKIYILVDIHDTIIESDYQNQIKDLKFYPDAIACLEELTIRPDVHLILWSSTTTEKLHAYQYQFKAYGFIHFDSFNENTKEKNTDYAVFDKKMYFNMIIDDKAGFDAETDWTELKEYLQSEEASVILPDFRHAEKLILKETRNTRFGKQFVSSKGSVYCKPNNTDFYLKGGILQYCRTLLDPNRAGYSNENTFSSEQVVIVRDFEDQTPVNEK